ncbi:hypothetical protein SAMN02745751_01273 [Dethiosulfatibacter aminovorans DSM 17477]|uniref:Uncharacterized protein n=1 Tax=Dethiosulfatibacter aminovorans DSM 17477 TaxID=1121476 RepID=A0A1M6EPG5_9FIRM|nr:hypothetical protein [Dethiosulfatibacter aminovorans]SHI87382.1 hypothetical protein SAMN02745751_01273 [Dethiosulfatibacter aminovorans DSM 17477]
MTNIQNQMIDNARSWIEDFWNNSEEVKEQSYGNDLKGEFISCFRRMIESGIHDDISEEERYKSCLKTAKHLAELNEDKRKRTDNVDPTTRDTILSQIQPHIEYVRKDLFGSKKVPFKSIKEAEDWLKRTNNKILEKESQDKNHLYMKRDDKFTVFPIYNNVTKETYSIYSDFDETLDKLIKHSEYIAAATGFPENEVPLYILAGLKPILYRYQVQTSIKGMPLVGCKTLKRSTITITINTSDLSLDELRSIYRENRMALHTLRTNKVTNKQQQILQLVQELGQPPEKRSKTGEKTGTNQYWNNALEIWNKRYPESSYKKGSSLMQAYGRAVEKIGVRY